MKFLAQFWHNFGTIRSIKNLETLYKSTKNNKENSLNVYIIEQPKVA